MIIAVYISPKKCRRYFEDLLTEVAIAKAEHQFIFFSDRPLKDLPCNATKYVASPKIKNRLTSIYWFNFKLPKLLKKFPADVFVTSGALLPAGKVWVNWIFADHLTDKELSAVKSAAGIIFPENYFRERFLQSYPEISSKAHVVLPPTGRFNFIEGNAELIRAKVAQGNNFIVFRHDESDEKSVFILLKSFSVFKRMQRSSLKLIISSEKKLDPEKLVKDFSLYKYRDDVIFISYPECEPESLINAAFIFISPVFDLSRRTGHYSLDRGVPMITSDSEINRQIFGKAVAYTDFTEKSLSETLMTIYKDEYFRTRLINDGKEFAALYNARDAVEQISALICGDVHID